MIPRPISGAARIIPALDSGDAARAQSLAETLAPHCGVLKVGLELFTSAGPGIVSAMARHRPVFLDLKLHDIPNTVASAVKSLKGRPCSLLTLHAAGGPEMIARAREAADVALPGGDNIGDRKSTRLNSSHSGESRMPSSA